MEFHSYNDNVERLGINQIFVIHKGKRRSKWKIIEHPNFDNAFALVSDHIYINTDNFMNYDIDHIVNGATTIEKVYKQAYDHT